MINKLKKMSKEEILQVIVSSSDCTPTDQITNEYLGDDSDATFKSVAELIVDVLKRILGDDTPEIFSSTERDESRFLTVIKMDVDDYGLIAWSFDHKRDTFEDLADELYDEFNELKDYSTLLQLPETVDVNQIFGRSVSKDEMIKIRSGFETSDKRNARIRTMLSALL